MPKEAAFIAFILRIRYLMTMAGDEMTYIYFYKDSIYIYILKL